MNIYLDIDGVILANDKQASLHVKEFLKYVTDNYPTYWLTTHCKGDSSYTIKLLSRFLDSETIEIARKIMMTNWSLSKTEAIDFNSPFLWFDDYLFDFEIQDLIKHNALNRWVKVDLSDNINQLLDITNNFTPYLNE